MTLRQSSQVAVVRENIDCRENSAVTAAVEYRQAAEHMQWALTRQGVRVPVNQFPSVLRRRREEGGTGIDAGADDHQPPDPSAGGWGISGRRCTPSEREGRRVITWTVRPQTFLRNTWSGSPQPSHADTYVGATASAAAAGVKRSRETAFVEANAPPLSEQF